MEKSKIENIEELAETIIQDFRNLVIGLCDSPYSFDLIYEMLEEYKENEDESDIEK